MNQTATKKCFQKYTAYKDSGIPWLGNIPEHWEILPGLSFIFEGKEKNTGMVRNTVLSLSYGNIRVREKEELTGLVPESFETYQLINKGDLIFRPTDLQNDKVSLRSSISNFDGIITNAYLNLRFKSNASPKFFHYFFRTIDNNKIIYGLGSGLRQNISFLDFRRFNFPFPPLPEQTAIANFLDNKTAKIDKAVSIIEKQISLLKERKQILIHELVTGKLIWNPDTKTWTKPAEVKDSGVEWIGEIPKHWVASKFKHYIKLRHGHQFLDGDFKSEGVQVVKISQLHKDGYLDLKNASRVSEGMLFKYSDILIKENDVLMCLTGGTIGKIIKVGKVDHPLLQNYRVGHFSTVNIKDLIPDYILPLMSSDYFQCQIFLELGETGQPNIGMEDLNNMMIVVPSTYEQQQIAFRIESTSQKIDQAISLKEREIEKLKEYKTSLINSVVTGKVRVN